MDTAKPPASQGCGQRRRCQLDTSHYSVFDLGAQAPMLFVNEEIKKKSFPETEAWCPVDAVKFHPRGCSSAG